MSTSRSVARVVDGIRQTEGGGFVVRRPFPTQRLYDADPFLLLDEMGPTDNAPGAAVGAPDHPHRGFETVTYLLDGEMEHADSQGHRGTLGPGDVQWMTAGAGVIHSELPSAAFQRRGGRMHGFQVWVNLPARDKKMRPRYQDMKSDKIPVGASEDGKVRARVVAGEALGAVAHTRTQTPIAFVHFTLAPGGRVEQPVPRDWTALAWIFAGAGVFGPDGKRARDGQLVVFEHDGDSVQLHNDTNVQMDILLLAGAPLGEPVARYGPFVMNTQQEILEAIDDFRAGRFGEIAPEIVAT